MFENDNSNMGNRLNSAMNTATVAAVVAVAVEVAVEVPVVGGDRPPLRSGEIGPNHARNVALKRQRRERHLPNMAERPAAAGAGGGPPPITTGGNRSQSRA